MRMARGMLIPFLTAVPEEPSPQYYSRCRSKSKRRPDLAIHRSFRWSLPTVEALFQLLPSTKGQSGPMRSHSIGRFCCKTPITPFDEFPANRPNGPRSPIDVAVRPLPRSPVSSSLDNVVPQSIIRSPRVRPGEFVFSHAKRLLQQNRHVGDMPTDLKKVCSWGKTGSLRHTVRTTRLVE